jgi:hypothetical protein
MIVSTLLRVILVLSAMALARTASGQPAPQLSTVRDDLYLARHGEQAALVLVAPDGILIADPLGLSGGPWLRDQVASRFPGKPVRYVVYMSPRFERSAGGAAFPTAAIVGQAQLNAAVVGLARTFPPTVAPLDQNRNARLERGEWGGSVLAAWPSADSNKDGVLTPREVWRIMPFAKTIFRDRTTLAIGGTRVEVLNPGNDHSSPALYFADQRTVYISTAHAFGPNGLRFADAEPRDVLAWLDALAALPFDTIVTDAGEQLDRRRFDEVRRFAADLRAAAIDNYPRRRSAARAAAAPGLQKYDGTPLAAQRHGNLEALFRSLRVTRVELQGAAVARWMQPNDAYCEGYDPCVSGGEIAGGTAALRVAMSRVGFVVEASFAEQFLASRDSTLDDEAYAQRTTRAAMLFRYGAKRPAATSFELVAGPSITFADTRGVQRIKQAVAPFGGRHSINERTITWGVTAGVNVVLPLSQSISLFVPIRATALPQVEVAERRPGRFDLQGGIGLGIKLAQSVR